MAGIKRYVLVFLGTHDLLVRGCLVFKTTEVQGTMENYPQAFFFERSAQGLGIVPYAVKTNIDLTNDLVLFFREIKGDDIGIIVVLQMVLVYLQEVLV